MADDRWVVVLSACVSRVSDSHVAAICVGSKLASDLLLRVCG